MTNNFIPQCENEFNNDQCGTFLEFHMPGNPQIIKDFKIKGKYHLNGYSSMFLSTKDLCSGRYEVDN
jgi:hypothetical protein